MKLSTPCFIFLGLFWKRIIKSDYSQLKISPFDSYLCIINISQHSMAAGTSWIMNNLREQIQVFILFKICFILLGKVWLHVVYYLVCLASFMLLYIVLIYDNWSVYTKYIVGGISTTASTHHPLSRQFY